MEFPLEVVVGVIKDEKGNILITQRDQDVHQGGLWEFPGGKIEQGETLEQALARELKEELDIDLEKSSPLITIHHDYLDIKVILRVMMVDQYKGFARPCEGQPMKWVNYLQLSRFKFPAANVPIIKAIALPSFYAILDDSDTSAVPKNLEKILSKGVKLIQARFKRISCYKSLNLIDELYPMCREAGAKLLLNSSIENYSTIVSDGLHLTSLDLLKFHKRPNIDGLIAASCHNLDELRLAEELNLDFAVLAPVLPTKTHPDATMLGWEKFSKLAEIANIPVFGLGGLGMEDLSRIRMSGGQGVAGIRAFL